MSHGFSHIGVATHNMDATIEFYTSTLGFRLVADHLTKVEGEGRVRQVYFDLGRDQFLVFMESKNIATIPDNFDTSINESLGTPAGMYHLSFKENDEERLEGRRAALEKANVEVSGVIDLGHAKSIFFFDPNGLQLEFCWHVRAFGSEDLVKVTEAKIAS